jgi:oxygen-independent coproporphyrinogen-3 oxidase
MNGFSNISIDLMYGLPNQTTKIWEQNLKQATSLGIQHLSAYHLIYEEKTRMYSMLKAGKIEPVVEEVSTAMFSMLIDWMKSHNFIHYEISAFGKEGYFSRHNTSYWKGNKYIGLGPAAHSFDGENRTWNVASLNRYIKGVEEGKPEQNSENLSSDEKYNEFILTGLRTMWGVDLNELKILFGEKIYIYCIENADKYLNRQLLTIEGNNLKLTREGIFISDGIMSDLMRV